MNGLSFELSYVAVARIFAPAGISSGQQIRIRGEGHSGAQGGPPGDLYVHLRVRADERFVRQGNDLLCQVTVPMTAAALGTCLPLTTLDGDEELDMYAKPAGRVSSTTALGSEPPPLLP